MKVIASKVKLYWRQHGTLAMVKRIILRICLPFFSYNPINFYVICGLPKVAVQPRCQLEIRKGSPKDISLLVDFPDETNEVAVRERAKYFFDKGGELFLVFSEGKLVHIAHLCYYPGIRETHPLEIHPISELKEDEVFIGFCQTHPEFRGKGIYPATLQHIVRYAVAQNKKRCFISSSPANLASIRGIERAGFSFLEKKRKFRLFGKMFNNQWILSEVLARI